MAITFYCPNCGRSLQADPQQVGTQVQCPRCQTEVTVPDPGVPLPDPGPFDSPLPRTRTSGLAVASLVLCLIPFTLPIGIVLAIVALIVVRRDARLTGAWMPIVGLIVALLVPLPIMIMRPMLREAMESARRAQCAGNLNGFGKSFRIYPSGSSVDLPAVARGPNGEVDNRAGLWLMVVSNMTSPEMLICPSDKGAVAYAGTIDPDRPFPLVDKHGQPDPAGRYRTCSYSYQLSNTELGNPSRERPNSTFFAIMADRAPPLDRLTLLPGSAAMSRADAERYLESLRQTGGTAERPSRDMFNSPNHAGKGQNVLYRDGHVRWHTKPWVGIEDDNIYTWATGESSPQPPDRSP